MSPAFVPPSTSPARPFPAFDNDRDRPGFPPKRVGILPGIDSLQRQGVRRTYLCRQTPSRSPLELLALPKVLIQH